MKVFLWKATHNSLAVKFNLWKKRISPSSQCPVCCRAQETIEHLFFVCPWTRAVWFGSSLQWVVSSLGLGSFDIWLMQKITTLLALSLDFNRDFSSLALILWSITPSGGVGTMLSSRQFDQTLPMPFNKSIDLSQPWTWQDQCKKMKSGKALNSNLRDQQIGLHLQGIHSKLMLMLAG